MRKFILTILVISFLCLVSFASAQIDLEQTYPEIESEGGTVVQQTITGKSTLPSLIQYFTNWALILSAIAVVISLIIGGIQYLTSSGRPEAMTNARKRIGNSFLGLAILAGSYLILVTINPQLTVMSLIVTPVDSGVILLTEQGHNDLTDPEKTFNDILLEGNAKVLATDFVDLTQDKSFGPLVLYNGQEAIEGVLKVNFANFPIYAIGFWGRTGGFSDNVKIVAYDDRHFEQSDAKDALNPREYIKKGKLDKEGGEDSAKGFRGSVPKTVGELSVNIIWVEEDPDEDPGVAPAADKTDFFLSKVDYINLERQQYLDKVAAGEKQETFPKVPQPSDAYHPPLSIAIKGTGPGLYLYSEEGGQRYILASHEDFGLSDMKFDNMADKIEINNYEKNDIFDPADSNKNSPTHDFLAVLHDYYHFTGNIRLLFNKTKKTTYIPQIYLEADFNKNDVVLCNQQSDEPDLCNLGDPDGLMGKVDIYDNGKYQGTEFRPGNIDLIDTANANKEHKIRKVGINVADAYGAIKDSAKTSSIQLFEMVPPIALTEAFEWSDFKESGERSEECREVRICTEKGGNGNCISYTPSGKVFPGAYNSITLPMPYFVPVNIPEKLKGIMKVVGKTGDEYKLENKKFADKIKSIYIRGDCLVVLFENRIGNLSVDANKNLSGAWDGDTAGSHSETFTKSDWDLTDNEIARCGSARGIGFGEPKGCASAIAVFPIRIIE